MEIFNIAQITMSRWCLVETVDQCRLYSIDSSRVTLH